MVYRFFVFIFSFLVILLCISCDSKDNKPVEVDLSNVNWEFRQADKDVWYPANVPGCVHTDLLKNDLIEDPFYRNNEIQLQWIDKVDWIYRCSFETEDEYLSAFSQAKLVFKGLDTYADVYLNDTLILSASNMHREWSVDVIQLLKGKNEIKVYFHSPIKVGLELHDQLSYELPAINDHSEIGGIGDKKVSVFVRKALHHFGWDWGPRFVTSGVWRPVSLEFYTNDGIDHIYFRQEHFGDTLVRVESIVSIDRITDNDLSVKISDPATGTTLAQSDYVSGDINQVSLTFDILNPELWWTNGLGDQRLYEFETSLFSNNTLIDEKTHRIGLRTIELVREEDDIGLSFYFELNGKPVYMKGANYIPQDMFPARVSPEKYRWILESARDANFNMIRVWGGGIYENDIFYDLCDQFGILVWQDFMFACNMHPGDSAFLENVRNEVIDNVIRLRNHPSLALWCGNNEMLQAWHHWGYHEGNKYGWTNEDSAQIWNDYLQTFHRIIPDVLAQLDPESDYWPSSPAADVNVPQEFHSGDYHYWKNRTEELPVTVYHEAVGRFMSEYGKGSYPEFNSVKRFTSPEDWSNGVRSFAKPPQEPTPPWRRKGSSNYFSRNFNTTNDFHSRLYLSQLLQYFVMDHAIEAHRWNKPVNMGTLFWMLDECWPVGCGSAVDYYGRWKAMMYLAKRNFNDLFITARFLDDQVIVYGINDKLENLHAEYQIEVRDFAGNQVWNYSEETLLDHNMSNILTELDASEMLPQKADPSQHYIHLKLFVDEKLVSENFKFFKPFKDLKLTDPEIEYTVRFTGEEYLLTLKANAFAKFVFFTLDSPVGKFSDNFFDLPAGVTKSITFTSPDLKPGLEGDFEITTLNMIN